MQARWRTATMAAATVLLAGCGLVDGAGFGGEPDRTEAVEHVGDVLAAAGHPRPAIRQFVRFVCGPTDENLGQEVVADPVTTAVPWGDVASVVEAMGERLPVGEHDPAAGAPAHEDRYRVDGDGWEVRWGASNAVQVDDGDAATVITVVGGGDVDGAAMQRWQEEGLVEFWHCG